MCEGPALRQIIVADGSLELDVLSATRGERLSSSDERSGAGTRASPRTGQVEVNEPIGGRKVPLILPTRAVYACRREWRARR